MTPLSQRAPKSLCLYGAAVPSPVDENIAGCIGIPRYSFRKVAAGLEFDSDLGDLAFWHLIIVLHIRPGGMMINLEIGISVFAFRR